MTTPEVVVDNNSPPSCAGEIAKIRLASRLASAKSLQIRPNKLPKSAITGDCGNLFGNQFEIAGKTRSVFGAWNAAARIRVFLTCSDIRFLRPWATVNNARDGKIR